MKLRIAVTALAAALAACSKEAPPAAPTLPPPPPVAAPAPVTPPPANAEPAPTPPAAEPPAKGAAVARGPEATPKPPPPVETALANSSTHGKVGDAKCRVCHKLQHDSWSASPHAAANLDCEGCHGGGVDFVKVMRDRTAAIAAGLVIPKPAFCRKCHKSDWQEGMYLRVHAHKVK